MMRRCNTCTAVAMALVAAAVLLLAAGAQPIAVPLLLFASLWRVARDA